MKINNNPLETGDARGGPSEAILNVDQDLDRFTERTPILSILCITYNHEKYIAQAIDSFLAQDTSFSIEIVIGEDCSTDKTLSIIENYRKNYPSLIRVITSDSNVGMIENFRRTLKACKGKYIAICEGDDYWVDTHKIQVQVEFLEGHPEYILTYHDAFPFDENGNSSSSQLSKIFQRDATEEDLIKVRPISTLTTCFKNILVDVPPEFNQSPILDFCIWSILGNYGKGKYLSNIIPAAYRVHDGGVFSKQAVDKKNRMTMHAFLCLSNYYARLGNTKISGYFIFRTIILGCSQITFIQKVKLIGAQLDSLFGSPIYLFLKIFTRR